MGETVAATARFSDSSEGRSELLDAMRRRVEGHQMTRD
jgi:hypothetical protein